MGDSDGAPSKRAIIAVKYCWGVWALLILFGSFGGVVLFGGENSKLKMLFAGFCLLFAITNLVWLWFTRKYPQVAIDYNLRVPTFTIPDAVDSTTDLYKEQISALILVVLCVGAALWILTM